MAFLDQSKLVSDVIRVLDWCEKSQWTHKPDFNIVKNYDIISRESIRNLEMTGDIGHSKTSGSTGEPVTIGKSYKDHVWYIVNSIREFRWLKFDVTKTIAIIKPGLEQNELDDWGIPKEIEPIQGKRFTIGNLPISQLQKWLEEKNPHYIHCFPSIFKQLDTTRITNFISWKGTGELGGRSYSSEECGIIALECPDNPMVYHVMENQICEVDTDNNLIITTLSNKYIKRYKHGDKIKLGVCHCGRSLQTISEITGRVRNMFVLENGDKVWPLVGSLEFEDFGIQRFQVIQTEIHTVELSIVCDKVIKEFDLIKLVRRQLGVDVNVIIKYVNGFKPGKFEEFISLV